MKKLMLLVCIVAIGIAGNYRAVPLESASIVQEGETKMFCNVCGMTLPMFYKTNHAAKVEGKTYQYCSIHCMHEHALKNNKKVDTPKVVDNDTLKFILSEDAFYVVGSKKPATMSTISKYAFGTKKSAEQFAKEFGGEIMSYDEVAKRVDIGLEDTIKMIQKRQAKAAKKGEQIYNKVCKKTDKRFKTAAEAKAYIKQNNLCGKLKGKPLQQVGLYLSR